MSWIYRVESERVNNIKLLSTIENSPLVFGATSNEASSIFSVETQNIHDKIILILIQRLRQTMDWTYMHSV
jgi:hypothetical protein